MLYVEPGTWDSLALWAPQVLPDPGGSGGYVMYYTGVNNAFAQQSGIALSPDLFEWAKIPWPVYKPDPSWAQWDESVWKAEWWCGGNDAVKFGIADKMMGE